MKELTEHAKNKLAEIEAIRTDGKTTLTQAFKQTNTSAGAYYQWKKIAKKRRKTPPRKASGPILQTLQIPTVAQRLVCVIGSVADIRDLIGGLT